MGGLWRSNGLRPHSAVSGLREACILVVADALEKIAETALLEVAARDQIEPPGHALGAFQAQRFLADALLLRDLRPVDLLALDRKPVEPTGHGVDEQAMKGIVGVERLDDVDLRLLQLPPARAAGG